MERAASGLFGIVTYGIHTTVYEEVRAADGEIVEYNEWPTIRRAATKQTWPGYLDNNNSVAGSIVTVMRVFDCVVKESMEEASMPAHVVRRHGKAAGSVSYFFRLPRVWLQPDIERAACFALQRCAAPEPLDGEVESLKLSKLLSLSEVIEHIRTGVFKYNYAPALMDSMARKSIITPDNKPDCQEIVTRLHGRFDHDTRWTSSLHECTT
ncbi:hypothetical protein BD309DRAFT_1021598 [Dichomitus squalens]|nr:hypothetical protein BD309DRAFT_1021598 [Dichomitus squalens]